MREALLRDALEAAVPLWIAELRHTTFEERAARAQRCAAVVAEHGDDILYRAKKAGATAAAFNRLAEGLACAAYQPGGIRCFGLHFEAGPGGGKVPPVSTDG